MKTALIQINAGNDKRKNIEKAVNFTRVAVDKKAKFILLPEVFNFRGNLKPVSLRQQAAEYIPGDSLQPLMELAKRFKVFILAGSIYEKTKKNKKIYNTSVLINPRGQIAGVYRKNHLFDAVIGKKKVRESDIFLAGIKQQMVSLNEFTVGLSICYDLRFPDLYQKYARQGVDILCVPSAFTYETGRAHFEILLKARAIENLSYVLAPNQTGTSGSGIRCYGNSMVISPWGEIMARASGNKEEIIYAELDKRIVGEKRKIFLSKKLRHNRRCL